MNEQPELTNEIIEDACQTGNISGYGDARAIKMLAQALKAEKAKVKVWDGARENEHTAMVVYHSKQGIRHSKDHTRTLPKTKARLIAEGLMNDMLMWQQSKENTDAFLIKLEKAILELNDGIK